MKKMTGVNSQDFFLESKTKTKQSVKEDELILLLNLKTILIEQLCRNDYLQKKLG